MAAAAASSILSSGWINRHRPAAPAISLSNESPCGPVPTLTGTVSLSVPANANTGTVLRLKGKGIPAHGGEPAGDLYARLVVTLPDGEDAELKKFVEGWKANYNPRTKLR